MLDKYKGLGKAKGFLIYTLCDETFSISSSITLPEGVNRKYFYLSISLLNYSYWVLGTALGGIVGNFITFNTNGLDFVLTALFVVLFLEQMKKKENRISGFIGLAGTIIGLSLFGANNVVIPSMLIILAILLAGRKKICC
jgi:4-azaleucine resistance transporter AzlC